MEETEDDSEYEDSVASCESSTIETNKRTTKKRKSPEEGDEKVATSPTPLDLSSIRGIKKQARYEPTVPMSSKAELTAWRKEARRIRNRESAAASRNKTRQRIEELEKDLSHMQKLYQAALDRIALLETSGTIASNSASVWSSAHQQAAETLASSLIHPSNDTTEDTPPPSSSSSKRDFMNTTDTYHQKNIMMSRPTADCVVSIPWSLCDAPERRYRTI